MEFIMKITHTRVARFALVGLGNTSVNFIILNLVVFGLHLNRIVSSIIATSCAITFSFVMNRGFVFNDRARPFRKFLNFTVVSAIGVLAIQTSVYALCVWLFSSHTVSNFVTINLSNLIASLCVMFWNYNGYRLFVFNGNSTGVESDEITETPNDTTETA
jgi:putative flippase GtrA